MSDEIERLRADLADQRLVARYNLDWFSSLKTEYDALQEENARLREALKPFAAMMDGEHMQAFAESNDSDWMRCFLTIGDLRAARAALKEPGDEKTGI